MKDGYYKDKVVVITGGSSGIGLAIAKEFAKQQSIVIIIGRDKEKLIDAKKSLEEITHSSSSVLGFPADISDNEQIKNIIGIVGEKFGNIDVLINCAGIITCGRFADQPVDDLEKCLFINYLGSVYASKAAWPWLKKAKGQLSFVCSVSGYLGLIGYSSYTPPKFALTGLAECLRMEGKDDGIRVSIIYPPDTDTPFLHYERKHTLPESIAISRNIKVMSSEKVAKIYFRGLQKEKFEIYCNFNSRFVRVMKNNLPTLFNAIIENVLRKARKQQKMLIPKNTSP